MNELRAADEAARDQALDVSRSFIVQAPAGSGKTELLTQRFLALLATVREPESILAITFTRKAAAEMRERILGALRDAERSAPHARGHQPRTLELARAVRTADDQYGWGLLRNPGRLRIQTIDALNLGLSRRLPLLSGLGAGMGVEEDARELYRLAAEQLLSHLPASEPLYQAAVGRLLHHLDNNAGKFTDLVVEMLGRREAWLPVLPANFADHASEGQIREVLEAARRSLVAGHLEALRAAFPDHLLETAFSVGREAAAQLRATGQQSPLLVLEQRTEVPRGDLEDADAWRALAELFLTANGAPRKPRGFNKSLGMPAGPAGRQIKARAAEVTMALAGNERLSESLHAVRRLPAPDYDAREWEVLKALLVVLRLAVAELELVFAGNATADFSRFALAARQALGSEDEPTDTALALDATLRHVLVDEFQDTSESQVRLLRALTAGWEADDGRTMFLVGDPMQSIYRFRNAEVGLFLSVRDQGLGDLQLHPLVLHVNFRSTQPLVSWINRTFSEVLPAKDDLIAGAVSYSRCISANGASREGGVTVHALLRRSRQHEAERVAGVVKQRLSEDPDANVGILVQSRNHLVQIVAELTAAGIAFRATDIDPLSERPIVLDLLSLTRALSHPADRVAWLAVLRAPWCGLTLRELHSLAGDDLEAPVLGLLRNPELCKRVSSDSGRRLRQVTSILEQSLRELRSIGLRDAVERSWLALGGPATATSVRELEEAEAFLDELAVLERRNHGRLDLTLLGQTLQNLYAPSTSIADTRVELLTVHKAKGLQFDTVIVPGLERLLGSDSRSLLKWMKLPEASGEDLIVAPVAQTGAEVNPLYSWLERLETGKLLEERRRVIYVAATRARQQLHLFGSCRVSEGDGGPTLQQPARSSALGMLWPVVSEDFQARMADARAISGEAAPPIAREPPLRVFPSGWQMPALPRGPSVPVRAGTIAPVTSPVPFDWASETARHVGTLVHRELQQLAGGGVRFAADDPQRRARYEFELAELGVPEDRRRAAAERVVEAIDKTLCDPRGQWLLRQEHRSAESELGLSGPIDQEIVNVVIDRTFIDEHGTRWIVDYKTSSHEGSGLDQFLDSEQSRYRPQLQRYAVLAARLGPEPVRLGLYFPLLSAWRDWSP